MKEEEDVPPAIVEEEEGITSQEEMEDEDDFDDDEEEGVTYEEEETEEGLDWEAATEAKHEDDEDETGSMSPSDALMDPEEALKAAASSAGQDPMCYHCGVLLVEPPLRLPAAEVTSPKISIPLHCEVCVRGIHSQCHLSLGGSLPTQEESFVCFHCKTSHKYEMKAADRVKIPVGPNYQAPVIPAMFFDCPTPQPLSVARERFVQVWSADAAVTVTTDRDIHDYLHRASQAWPDRLRVASTGGSLAAGSVRRLYVPRAAVSTTNVLNHYWCPFSPEYALTVLHKCDYDPQRALAVIKNPALRDCFSQTCFPPTKPYYNKWKPKDRRWRMMKIPFPSSRVEAPDVYSAYAARDEGEGPRLRSRRHNYAY